MRKKVFLAGIISLGLIFALVFSACKSDDDSSGGNSDTNNAGSSNGIGSITITGLKAGLNGARIAHNTVTGSHQTLGYTLVGGVWSGVVLDTSGFSTIQNGSVTISVQGSAGTTYGFTNGRYNVNFTISNATDTADDGNIQNFAITFNGSSGTGQATGNLAP